MLLKIKIEESVDAETFFFFFFLGGAAFLGIAIDSSTTNRTITYTVRTVEENQLVYS